VTIGARARIAPAAWLAVRRPVGGGGAARAESLPLVLATPPSGAASQDDVRCGGRPAEGAKVVTSWRVAARTAGRGPGERAAGMARDRITGQRRCGRYPRRASAGRGRRPHARGNLRGRRAGGVFPSTVPPRRSGRRIVRALTGDTTLRLAWERFAALGRAAGTSADVREGQATILGSRAGDGPGAPQDDARSRGALRRAPWPCKRCCT